MKSSCGNCQFAWEVPGVVGGNNLACRRFPPSVQMAYMQVKPTPSNPQGMQPMPTGAFPPTNKDQWCGEHAPKAAANES